MTSQRSAPRTVLAYLPIHVLVTAWTWRDLRRRSDAQIRGSRRGWQVASAVNTLGSVVYLFVGRRPTT